MYRPALEPATCEQPLAPTSRVSELDNDAVVQPAFDAAKVVSHDSTSESRRSVEVTRSQSVEVNSGTAFARNLAQALDPTTVPRLHLVAWNLFLDSGTSMHRHQVRPLTDLVSRADMESLAAVYLAKVDPCYGFVDHDTLGQHMQWRWNSSLTTDETHDATLCGVAALGRLFSRNVVDDLQIDLLNTAMHILERSTDVQPGLETVTGWVLRVVYLRMTAPAHVAWMNSCTMMHIIEASGIHDELSTLASPDLGSRILGVARHLNLWLSFDTGRSRVVLPHPRSLEATPRPGDYTKEILDLLSPSEELAPENNLGVADLKASLIEVMNRSHSKPPSILAQSNLILCMIRRLKSLGFAIYGELLNQIVTRLSAALVAAQALLMSGSPWHQVANVPFQVVCILLAIDSPSTIVIVRDAVKILGNAAQYYPTSATRDAMSTACLLTLIHEKRKAADAKELSDVLQIYSPSLYDQTSQTSFPAQIRNPFDHLSADSWWDDTMADFNVTHDFSMGDFMSDITRPTNEWNV